MGQWRKLIRNKKVDAVTAALNRVLIPLKDSCYTVTFDTGKEFAGHKSIASALQVEIHFVDIFAPGSADSTRAAFACCSSTSHGPQLLPV